MTKMEQLYEEWLSLQPVKEEYQQRLDQKFMLEFNYNSNHIEGNTLTYGQTELLLKFGEVSEPAKMKDLEEMKAHNLCLNIIKMEAKDADRPLTETFIRELHKTMLREDYTAFSNDNKPYTVHAGIYKTRPNSVKTVTGELFEYASVEETPALMTDLVAWYKEAEEKNEMTPVELAALFHYRYIRIHPFEDGNGRISRLIVNYILAKHGYPMIVVKSDDKTKYLTVLHQCDVAVGSTPAVGAHAELSQIKPLVDYLAMCEERALRLSIKAAKGEDISDADDWKKNLKTKYANRVNKPELSDEIQTDILDNEYQPLLDRFDTEFSELYSIFKSVKWDKKTHVEDKFHYNEITFSIDGPMGEIITTVFISVELQQFCYRYRVHTVRRNAYELGIFSKELTYDETLSKEDKTAIINGVGKYLNDFVESKGLYKR
ncbi:MAG: Fic family protein [Bacteroidales bacterium]|nr:Fic family protein [Bacteroidales bacterium]